MMPCMTVQTAVLSDVPCTGLGVLAKKPDIRYKSLEGLEDCTQCSAPFCIPLRAM